MFRHLIALLVLSLPFAAFAEEPVKIARGDTTLEFTVGSASVAKYQYAGTVAVEKGEGTKPLAKPFFYPVLAPNGTAVTRAWPMVRGTAGETTDHFHQKSVWFCHGDVIPVGLALKNKSADKRVEGIDFWAELANHGRIVCTKVSEPKQVRPNHASVETLNEWQASDGTKVMDESRTIHFVSLPAGRLFILEIDLHASVCPIEFGDTKEGSMGVRVPDGVALSKPAGGTIVSSTGDVSKAPAKDNLPLWGKPADWHDYSSTAGGIAIFDDPKNPHRSNWHTRAYGLMAANPFGRDKSGFPAVKGKTDLVKIEKGAHLKLRYGVYAHNGDTTAGKVADAFAEFTKTR